MARVMIVEAERSEREALAARLVAAGHEVIAEPRVRPTSPVARATSAARGAEALLGRSRPLRDLLALVAAAAACDSAVLISGEPGTGKALAARALHDASRRRACPFVLLDASAHEAADLEAELFGQRRAAAPQRRGLLEAAHGGTLLIEDVSALPWPLQAKLVRFLRSAEGIATGFDAPRRIDVRIVATTHRDPEREVAAGRLREDLYYGIAVIPIVVPPLRERAGDAELLAHRFVERLAERAGRRPPAIAAEVLERLAMHAWPGNVRELETAMEHAFALGRGDRIGVADLPERLRRGGAAIDGEAPAPETLEGLERRHILATLERVGWNRRRAAELLQISTTTLWRRLKGFGVEGPAESPHAIAAAAHGP